MTFLVDPPLLVAAGAVIERFAPARLADALETGTAAAFLAGSVAAYLDAGPVRWLWQPFGAESGRDWMLNSGLFDLEHRDPPDRTHLAAAALFATYPVWPKLGRWLVRRARP